MLVDFGLRKSAFNGDLDPFYKHNKIGVHVESQYKTGGLHDLHRHRTGAAQQGSGLTVVTSRVDRDGYIVQSGRSDRPKVKTGERATLVHYANGNASWRWKNHDHPADDKYDNPQLAKDNAQREAAAQAKAKAQAEREAARQQLAQKERELLNESPRSWLTICVN